MDPLSAIGSSLAILGAITATGKGIHKLVSLHRAPVELQALTNDIEALRGLLLVVQSCLLQINGSSEYHESEHAYGSLLGAVHATVQELHGMIEFRLKKAHSTDGQLKINKTAWLKATPEIERCRQKIRDARDNLNVGLTTLNLRMVDSIRRQTIQIQSISLTQVTSICESSDIRSSQQLCVDPRTQELNPGDPSDEPSLNRALSAVHDTSKRTNITQRGMVRITTTMAIDQCPKLCHCQCHARSNHKSPSWLRGVFGQLMFNYTTSTILNRPCDSSACRRSARKSQFTYVFPTWLALRALTVSGTLAGLSGAGASIALRMPVIIESNHQVWEAISHDNVDYVRNCLANRIVDLHAIDERGNNLLNQSVVHNGQRVFQLLISQGADYETVCDRGTTAVSSSLRTGSIPDLFPFLDEEDMSDLLGFTRLHAAIVLPSHSELESMEFPEFLKYHTQSLEVKDRAGMTPLHWAVRGGDVNAVTELMKYPVNVRAQDFGGWTALHYACWLGRTTIARALLCAGADVKQVDADGATALFKVWHLPELVDALVEHGADVDAICMPLGWTALHSAARKGDIAVVQRLLHHGADRSIRNTAGATALEFAIAVNSFDGLRAFIDFDTERKIEHQWPAHAWTLMIAAMSADTRIMRLLQCSDLRGMPPGPDLSDCHDNTAEECFYELRDEVCMRAREPFEEEEKAWKALFHSWRVQNGRERDIFELEDGEVEEADNDPVFLDALEELKLEYDTCV